MICLYKLKIQMKNTIKLFIVAVIAFSVSSCQKEGCTDPTAYNYNPDADTDDGSCTFQGCTDPNATNYDPLATISSTCIYDQVGSWTSTYQEISGDVTMSVGGFPIYDTTFSEITHPDSLEPAGLDFIPDGNLYVHYTDEPTDTGSWVRTGDNLSMTMMDTTLIMLIDSVDGTFMRLTSSGSESESDMGVQIDYNYNMKLEFSRN